MQIVILAGAGDDTITGTASANFGDSISAGAGDDDIQFGNTDLTSADTVDGRCKFDHLQCCTCPCI